MIDSFCTKGILSFAVVFLLCQLNVNGQLTSCPTDNIPPVEDAVINGDFEQGPKGRSTFESDHEWAGDKIKANLAQERCNEGTVGHYFIGKEEEYFCDLREHKGTSFHVNFGTPFNSWLKDLPDHTLGKGYMLQIDSDADPSNAIAWQQKVNIHKNQEYFFSCWLANLIQSAGDAQIAFYVKGSEDPLGDSPTDPCYRLDATCADGATKAGFSAPGVMEWAQYTATWESKNHTSAIITIFNQSKVVEGNDYALDDISFINNCGQSEEPIPSLGPNLSICETDGMIELDTKIGKEVGRMFYWYDVDNGKFLKKGEDLDKYVIEEPGRYMVCVEDNSPCPKIDHIDILDTMSVSIEDIIMCEGDEAEVKSGKEKHGHLEFEWDGPSTNMGNEPNTKVNKNGQHTLKITSTKFKNCKAEDEFMVEEVLPQAEWEETDTLCVGQDVVIKGTGPDADEYTYWDAPVGGKEYLPGGKQITIQFDQFPAIVYVENKYGCRIPIELEENCPCDNPTPTTEPITVCVDQDINLNADVESTDNPRFFWFGPNGFESKEKNPTIPNATTDMAGDYFVYIKTETCNYPSDTVSLKVEVLEGEKLTPSEISVNDKKLEEGDTVDICISDPITIFGANPKTDENGVWNVEDPAILTLDNLEIPNPAITLLAKGITKIEWTIDKEGDGLCPIIPTKRTIYINVLGLPGELQDIEGPNIVCEGYEITYSVPKVEDATFYEWFKLPPGATGSSTSESITIKFGSEGGQIGLRAGNICGEDTVIMDVDVIIGPKASVENEAIICGGQTYTIKDASIENTQDFVWELIKGNPNNLTGTETLTPTYSSGENEGGTTVVLVLKANAASPCEKGASDTLKLVISEIPEFTVTQDTICENETAILKVVPKKNYPNVIYQWYNSETEGTMLSEGETYATGTLTTDLEIWVEANGSCEVPRVKTTVKVHPLPNANFTCNTRMITEKGEAIELIDLSIGGTNGTWYFGDGNQENYVSGVNPTHVYDMQMGEVPPSYLIRLNLVTEYGCKDTAILNLPVDLKWAIFIPNAFTPNTDGYNDDFSPKGYGIEEYEMWIFNRWGEVVFHSEDINKKWDGKMKGNEIKSDTYTYKVKVKNIYGKAFDYVGRVTLLQ